MIADRRTLFFGAIALVVAVVWVRVAKYQWHRLRPRIRSAVHPNGPRTDSPYA